MPTPEDTIDAVANESPPYWNHTDIIATLNAAGYVIVSKDDLSILDRMGHTGTSPQDFERLKRLRAARSNSN